MRKRFHFTLLAMVVVIAAAAGDGSFAAPRPNAALSLSFSKTSAITKVQYACGWTYSCTNLGNGANGAQNVQIYGPVNVYTGADAKPEEWRVPEGASPWTGDQGSQTWRGWGCGGYPCDENCGAFCWFNRVRNGYCGHGCDAYRQHVMFQPYTVVATSRQLRPYIYQNPPDGGYGYGSQDGYGYGGGGASYYGSGYSQTSASQGGYGQGYSGQQGYGYSGGDGGGYQNGSQGSYDQGAPAPQGERFIDRLRRYFYGRPRGDVSPNSAAAGNNGGVRFERPSNDLVPLRRFNGPKYPPDGSQPQRDRPLNIK